MTFTLSAPAVVGLAVLTTGSGGGEQVASLTHDFAAGRQTMVWNGQATAGWCTAPVTAWSCTRRILRSLRLSRDAAAHHPVTKPPATGSQHSTGA